MHCMCGRNQRGADNQWEVDWELQQEFIDSNGAGVASKGTGSSHTVFAPRVQK